MRNSKGQLIVVYILMPLLILSFFMSSLVFFVNQPARNQDSDFSGLRAFETLDARPVSLMCKYTSGNWYQEMQSVKADFDDYNSLYGNRLSIHVATGNAATLNQMKSYISTTERMHLASHGTYVDNDPKITMYGGYLTPNIVGEWSLTNGLCKVIYLSACNGMGHNGQLDTDLADMLRTHTSVNAVIGFKDVANILGATLLSQSFWGYHVTLTSTGGYSTASSFSSTYNRIVTKLELIKSIISLEIDLIVALILELCGTVVGAIFVGVLLAEITTVQVLDALLGDAIDTVHSWEIVGDSVPGLSWSTGGGGGHGGEDTMD